MVGRASAASIQRAILEFTRIKAGALPSKLLNLKGNAIIKDGSRPRF